MSASFVVPCLLQKLTDETSLSGHSGAKGLGVLHHLPFFRQFFHFHKNPSSSVISGTLYIYQLYSKEKKNGALNSGDS